MSRISQTGEQYSLLSGRHLIVASDRGPVEQTEGDDGRIITSRVPGGLVTALSALPLVDGASWVHSGNGPALSESVYRRHIDVACTALWFAHHGMSELVSEIEGVEDAWREAYTPVNRAFADAIIERASEDERRPVVMVQDPHLYLVARMVRARLPNALIEHFVDVPWPEPAVWDVLPSEMAQSITYSLGHADLVGLQTPRDVEGFLECCQAFVTGAEVDHLDATVTKDGRTVAVRSYLACIDSAELRRVAQSSETKHNRELLGPFPGDQTIVRIDRVDPTKNIVRGFRAFSLFLERYPEMVGKVRFLACLVTADQDVPIYRRCKEDIDLEVQAVNNRFQTGGLEPITVLYGNDRHRAVAAMGLYDVLLVNPVADGMNLVSKEGPVVNRQDGVLVLSTTTGSHRQMNEGAVSIDPMDVEGTAEAMHQALTMPEAERTRRAETLRKAVERDDSSLWLNRQIEDLLSLR